VQGWPKNIVILFIVSISTSDFAFAQNTPTETDSTHFYENIESYSNHSKLTKFIYHIFFKPVANSSKKSEVKKKVYPKLKQTTYKEFEGKTIRYINIETLGPFGYLIADIIVVPHNKVSVAGNNLHINTQNLTIRNLLLIHQNQKFDSLLVKESERLVRSRVYISDVSFFVRSTFKNSDSIDIFIFVLDKWSIIPNIEASPSSISFYLSDKNFSGLGHDFENSYSRNLSRGNNSYNTNYYIPNIKNTYISSAFHLGLDGDKKFNNSLVIDRPFFSPVAKWAAGVSFTSQYRRDSLKNINSVYVPVNLRYWNQDYWAGFAQQIFKRNIEKGRATNLILAGRYIRVRNFEKPHNLFDPSHIYSNQDFYLAGIGISTRTYVQDKYVFNYGVTEDVPVGKVIGLTGGYQVQNDSARYYLGVRFSFGKYYDWGYLSSDFEYGTYLRVSKAEQGVVMANIIYFSKLFEVGKFKIRQFVKPQVTFGIRRFAYDSLTINNENGLRGFNSISVLGTRKIVLTFQTQSYIPYSILGFHFGPFLVYSFGLLKNSRLNLKNSEVFSLFSCGVLIRNDNIVLNTFQISLSFYPVIPGIGRDIFKANSFSTSDFGFSDFIIGKPATVLYQ
jgi:hypothetical protein